MSNGEQTAWTAGTTGGDQAGDALNAESWVWCSLQGDHSGRRSRFLEERTSIRRRSEVVTGTTRARSALPLLSAAWQVRLQRVDNSWLDMVPLPVLGSSRAFRELGWSPSVDAMTVIREVLSGMCHRDVSATPTVRHRSVSSAMRDLVTRGPVGQRNRL
jgi:hypothetical protein